LTKRREFDGILSRYLRELSQLPLIANPKAEGGRCEILLVPLVSDLYADKT
jgi:hypothetical protein